MKMSISNPYQAVMFSSLFILGASSFGVIESAFLTTAAVYAFAAITTIPSKNGETT